MTRTNNYAAARCPLFALRYTLKRHRQFQLALDKKTVAQTELSHRLQRAAFKRAAGSGQQRS